MDGEWVFITAEEYHQIIQENGGIDNLALFGCYTEIAGQLNIFGEALAKEDDIYTEWGRKGEECPLVYTRRRGTIENPKWEYGKYVKHEEE